MGKARLYRGVLNAQRLRLGDRKKFVDLNRTDAIEYLTTDNQDGADIQGKLDELLEELKKAGVVRWEGITVSGDVEDGSAGDVEDAKVELINKATGEVIATTETDASGDYDFDELDDDEPFVKFWQSFDVEDDRKLIIRASKEEHVTAEEEITVSASDDGTEKVVATIDIEPDAE